MAGSICVSVVLLTRGTMSRRTCHRCECARVSLAGNSRHGESFGQSGLVGHDSTRSGRPEPTAWHDSEASQESGGGRNPSRIFPARMIFQAETQGGRSGQSFGRYTARRVTASLWHSGATCSAQQKISECRSVLLEPSLSGGVQQTPEDADIPNDMD